MRRVLAWFANGVAALSLLLLIATVTLWLLSYRVGFAASSFNNQMTTGIVFIRGEMLAYRQLFLDEQSAPRPPVRRVTTLRPAPHLRPYLADDTPTAFGFAATWGSGLYPTRQLLVPAWALALALVIPPVRRALTLHRRRRERRLGLCPSCGYDLRATPRRCPECGRGHDRSGQGEMGAAA